MSLHSLPSHEIDVAVVGAGAAGIAAGRTLAGAPCSFLLLEAGPRIGGRAWTADVGGFAQDLGCGWLHSGDINPWTPLAEAAGFSIDRTPAPWSGEGRDLSFAEDDFRDYRAAIEAFYARLGDASEEAIDRPASDFLEPGNRWNALINAISTFANGAELDRVSVRDVMHYADDGVNWRVREGYGTAIAAHGANLPVALDCRVERIDWSGRPAILQTSRGTLRAKAVIVTVPTSLLALETPRFVPLLPAKLDAACGLPLGLADKVLLALDQPEEFPIETRVFGDTTKTGTGGYHLRPFGRPLIEGFFGGSHARDLEREGEAAFAAAAIEELAGRFGGSIRSRLKPLAVTRWSNDPLARGSYSHALPGKADARSILAQPVENVLFFSGEACSETSFSTAHGAFETGVGAAELALGAIDRS